MRKIKQICDARTHEFIALCEDGTVWRFDWRLGNPQWSQLADIPMDGAFDEVKPPTPVADGPGTLEIGAVDNQLIIYIPAIAHHVAFSYDEATELANIIAQKIDLLRGNILQSTEPEPMVPLPPDAEITERPSPAQFVAEPDDPPDQDDPAIEVALAPEPVDEFAGLQGMWAVRRKGRDIIAMRVIKTATAIDLSKTHTMIEARSETDAITIFTQGKGGLINEFKYPGGRGRKPDFVYLSDEIPF